MAKINELFQDGSFTLKFIELVICSVNVALITDGVAMFATPSHVYGLCIATGGYVLILSVGFMVYIMDKPSVLTELIFVVIGAILNGVFSILQFFAYSGLIIRKGPIPTKSIIVAILMLIVMVLMIYDCVLLAQKL